MQILEQQGNPCNFQWCPCSMFQTTATQKEKAAITTKFHNLLKSKCMAYSSLDICNIQINQLTSLCGLTACMFIVNPKKYWRPDNQIHIHWAEYLDFPATQGSQLWHTGCDAAVPDDRW